MELKAIYNSFIEGFNSTLNKAVYEVNEEQRQAMEEKLAKNELEDLVRMERKQRIQDVAAGTCAGVGVGVIVTGAAVLVIKALF